MERLAIDGGTPASPVMLGYGHQSISQADVDAVTETLTSDWLTCGPATERFESMLEDVTGAAHVTAVANGTAALHVACLALGLGAGDEVIVSPITFAASANCVLYCGATPVFADIDPATWNISARAIREKVTDRTRAVIAVDFAGVPADLDAIRAVCDEFGLALVEDAAHSIGSLYRGRPVGSIADVTTFSFHPVKTVTSGEGGALATNDEALAGRIRLFAKHGITRDPALLEESDVGAWHYEELELGYNYRISDIQAALGSSQLSRLDEFASRRRELVAFYDREFASVDGITFQRDDSPETTVRHLYVLRFDVGALETSRRFVFDALTAENIGVNVHYLPVYRLPYYARLGYDPLCCPEANRYYDEAVTIPLHCCLSDEDARHVVDAVRKVVGGCGGRR